jgi:toxin-antitoxin system PIN domain toxin
MHLLDVNVWVALAFRRHLHHASAAAWFAATSEPLCFCRITQAGFLRLATNRAALGPAAVTASKAWEAYDTFRGDSNILFLHEPEGLEDLWRIQTRSRGFSPKRWTDT